jgi:hypothetical protein
MNDLLDIARGANEDAQPTATKTVISKTVAVKAPSSATSEPSVKENAQKLDYELGSLLYLTIHECV